MKKVWISTLASLLLTAPSAMGAEIWSDAIYTQQTPTSSSTAVEKVFYPTYDEVKALGCQDAKFSLGEGWYCKDPVQQTSPSKPVEEPTKVGNQNSGTIQWSDPSTTENWAEEVETTEQWTEAETTEQWTDSGYTEQWTEAETTEQWADSGYTEQWTEAETTEQWADSGHTEQWTDSGTTEQWADSGNSQQWADTPGNSGVWSDNFEIPVPQSDLPEVEPIPWGPTVFETDPINENGRLLVPLRELFELLGATVDWNAQTKTVTAKKKDTTVQLTVGSKTANVNGQAKTLDVPGRIVNGKTMIPLRFVSEAFGEKVGYDAKKLEVTVGKWTIFLPPPKSSTANNPASNAKSNSNVPYGGMTDQQWETQKILDKAFNNSFNLTGTYRPSYQWNSGY